MDKVIGNKKVYDFVKKYKKDEWDNVVELLCLIGVNAVKVKDGIISVKELKDIAEGKGSGRNNGKGGYVEINKGKKGNEVMIKDKERAKSVKGENVKGNNVYRKGNEGRSNVNVIKNKKENNINVKVQGVDTKKQPQQKEQQIKQDVQPLKTNENTNNDIITSTLDTKQQQQMPSILSQQPLTTYQPAYNYLSQSYTFRNNNTLLNTVSPCYHCHNHIHCQHHHYYCKYHCQYH